MAWRYFSYYNLIRHDPAFDCLSSLACMSRYTAFSNSSSGEYWAVRYCLVPVAEVRAGALIRGDALNGWTGAGGAVSPNVYPANVHAGGRYYFELYGVGSSTSYLFRPLVEEKIGYESLRSNEFPYRITRRTYSYNRQSAALNVTANPATYDATNQIVSVDATVYIADVISNIKTQFESDFPGASFDLDSSFSFSEKIEISRGASLVEFNPVTSPLFTIPFI